MLLKPPAAQAWTVALPNPPPLRATATIRERLSRGQREGLTGVEQRSLKRPGVGRRAMPSLFSFPGTCSEPGAEGRAQPSRAGLETASSQPGLSCRFLPPGWMWVFMGPGLVRRTRFWVLAHLEVPPASGPPFLCHQLGKMLPP
ncbi:unnamed protein product [Rangifer tarandus platyrhynchus]|uniref:Uncharacterized protein n=1 Tax=Rangifer tarandus platyrhynchus TaxID=3082113 RepID=A0ABN8ZJC6_RANTA|nr:unnamed protein product [Rangifer tarandus platyrhynchus]